MSVYTGIQHMHLTDSGLILTITIFLKKVKNLKDMIFKFSYQNILYKKFVILKIAMC